MAQECGKNDPDVLGKCAAAMIIADFNADLETANQLAERAVTLNPNHALAWSASAFLKRSLGQHQLAVEHFDRALKLNPFDPFNGGVLTGKAWAHFLLEQYQESRNALQSAQAAGVSPKYLPALRLRAALYAAEGDLKRARDVAAELLQLNPSERVSNVNVVRYARSQEDREKVAVHLRQAGLPD